MTPEKSAMTMPEEIWWDGNDYNPPIHAGDFDRGFTREEMNEDKAYARYVKAPLPTAPKGDRAKALEAFEGLYTALKNEITPDALEEHAASMVRAYITAPEAESVSVPDEYVQKLLQQKIGNSFPSLEYTMKYVLKTLSENGLKIIPNPPKE